MKRFIFTVLGVAVFFVGLGALVDNVGAKFKSDEKALDLVRKARVAIGGDSAINGVQSLRVVGQTTRTVKINGADTAEQGETEIALQFPDKFMRMSRITKDDGNGLVEKMVNKQFDLVVVGDAKEHMKIRVDGEGHGEGTGTGVGHKIVIRTADGAVKELTGEEAAKFIAKEDPGMPAGGTHTITLKKNPDGSVEKVVGAEGENIILRKAHGGNVTFTTKEDGKMTESGDKNVVFERSVGAGGAMKMAHGGAMKQNDFLRTTLALLLTAPQGMDVSYTFAGEGDVDGTACNIVNAAFGGSSYKLYLNKSSNLPVMMSYRGSRMPQVFTFRTKADGAVDTKDVATFERKIDAAGETAEFNVKFSDYRSVNGVQLPYKWTQTVGGAADETFDVTSYEINPANIGERFQNEKVMVRTAKPATK